MVFHKTLIVRSFDGGWGRAACSAPAVSPRVTPLVVSGEPRKSRPGRLENGNGLSTGYRSPTTAPGGDPQRGHGHDLELGPVLGRPPQLVLQRLHSGEPEDAPGTRAPLCLPRKGVLFGPAPSVQGGVNPEEMQRDPSVEPCRVQRDGTTIGRRRAGSHPRDTRRVASPAAHPANAYVGSPVTPGLALKSPPARG